MSSALIVRHLLNRCEHIFHVATHGRALFAFKLCCRGSLSHLTAPSYPKWANDNIWRLTERKSSEDKEKDRTNPPPHTHTCMYKYMGKTRPRPLNDKALPVWNNAHITTHHHHSAKKKVFSCSYIKLTIVLRAKAKSFSKNHFQTDKILYCMTTQTALCRDRRPLWHLLSFWANCWETQTLFMVQSPGK